MKQWRIYGTVNDGHDGFPNCPAELTCADYYSGENYSPSSHDGLIRKFCEARNSHTRNIAFIGYYTNLNSAKYRRYEAEISPNYQRNFVKREFLTRCTVVAE